MRLPKIHIVLGTFLLVLMGTSLTFSTLHSHHHLSWNHPPEMADTGNCFTEDSTLCPICGYLFDPELPSVTSADIPFFASEVISTASGQILPEIYTITTQGRSPPVLG